MNKRFKVVERPNSKEVFHISYFMCKCFKEGGPSTEPFLRDTFFPCLSAFTQGKIFLLSLSGTPTINPKRSTKPCSLTELCHLHAELAWTRVLRIPGHIPSVELMATSVVVWPSG